MNHDIYATIEEKTYFRNHSMHTQVLFISFNQYDLKSAFVYIRETPTKDEIKVLKKDFTDIDLVMGDINLDPNRSDDLKKLDYLCSERKRVLSEVTTTRFNQLDHVLLNVVKFPIFFTTSFINHTTDHHSIIIRIAKEGNVFSQPFLEKMSFDIDAETKQPKRRKLDKDINPKKVTKKIEEEKKGKSMTNRSVFNEGSVL